MADLQNAAGNLIPVSVMEIGGIPAHALLITLIFTQRYLGEALDV